MAREDLRSKGTAGTAGPRGPLAAPNQSGASERSRRKVSVMPFAVLLPRIGEVGAVADFAEMFQTRIEELQAERQHETENSEEVVKRRLSEEAMLTQVLQWLSVDRPA